MPGRHLAGLLAAVLLLAGLAGCGQMGPLTLPEPAAESDDESDDDEQG